ncbi:MAG: hypothetical protein ACRBB3_08290 [Alphaproteobacteria bacterium]
MTDKQRKIPLKDLQAPVSEPKSNMRINGISSFILILLGLVILFISPAPAYLLSLLPNSYVETIFSGVYKELIIDNLELPITDPQKIITTKEFPLLGRDTGLCFSFSTPLDNSEKKIDAKILEKTKYGEPIAEIIAISKDKTEYQLNKVTSDRIDNKIIVCHKFSKRSSIIPNNIENVYIRPLTPLTPDKVVWRTVKDTY